MAEPTEPEAALPEELRCENVACDCAEWPEQPTPVCGYREDRLRAYRLGKRQGAVEALREAAELATPVPPSDLREQLRDRADAIERGEG